MRLLGGTILMEAHDQSRRLCLEPLPQWRVKEKKWATKLAPVVYEGKWFTPLREAIQAFRKSTF